MVGKEKHLPDETPVKTTTRVTRGESTPELVVHALRSGKERLRRRTLRGAESKWDQRGTRDYLAGRKQEQPSSSLHKGSGRRRRRRRRRKEELTRMQVRVVCCDISSNALRMSNLRCGGLA